jgi:hypothetical protein
MIVRAQINYASRKQDASSEGGELLIYEAMFPMLSLGPGVREVDMQGLH